MAFTGPLFFGSLFAQQSDEFEAFVQGKAGASVEILFLDDLSPIGQTKGDLISRPRRTFTMGFGSIGEPQVKSLVSSIQKYQVGTKHDWRPFWGIRFKAWDGKYIHEVYTDSRGELGLVNGRPVIFEKELARWIVDNPSVAFRLGRSAIAEAAKQK